MLQNDKEVEKIPFNNRVANGQAKKYSLSPEESQGTFFESETIDILNESLAKLKYSCFEKGCPTKPYATIPKGIMGNGVHGS